MHNLTTLTYDWGTLPQQLAAHVRRDIEALARAALEAARTESPDVQ